MRHNPFGDFFSSAIANISNLPKLSDTCIFFYKCVLINHITLMLFKKFQKINCDFPELQEEERLTEQSWNIWRIAFAKRKATRKVAAYNERQILSQVQSNSIKSKHGSFCRILRRKILSTKPYFLLQVFLAWKEVCFDRIDKVRKSVQFYLPPSEPPMFKPSQLPTPVSRYQGKVSRKSSVLA